MESMDKNSLMPSIDCHWAGFQGT